MLWAYGSYVGGRVLVLVSVAILARLLDPKDFGVVALALIFTGLMQTIKDLGVSQALVVSPEEELRDRADTAFVFSVGMGVLLTIVCAALGPVAASFFDEPMLMGIMPVLGATFVIRALGSTHYALAQRAIDFRKRTIGELADVIVRGASGIALAFAGAGAWSIVLGYVCGSAAMTVAMWLLVDWRPRMRVGAHLGSLLRFGGALTGVDLNAAVIGLVDAMFVGRVLGSTALGLYALGFRLPELLIFNLSIVAGQVLYPAFAAIGRERLGEAFLMSLRYTLLIALPMTVILAVLAEPIILAAFGDQWRGSIDVMRVLALYAAASTIGIPAGTAYKATGRAGILLALALPRTVILIVALTLFVDEGIVAVAACQAIAAFAFDLVGILLASRLLHVGLPAVVRAAGPPIVASAGMAVPVVGIVLAFDGGWPAIVVGGLAGGLVYLALLWLLARDSVEHLRGLVLARGKSAPEEAGRPPALDESLTQPAPPVPPAASGRVD